MKRIAYLVIILSIVVFVVACGLAWTDATVIPASKVKTNYNKMFQAAISTGAKLGYHPEYQDKKHGLIKLLSRVGTTDYRINVHFDRKPKGDCTVQVIGETGKSVINPFISNDVKQIEAAILKAAGMQSTKTK